MKVQILMRNTTKEHMVFKAHYLQNLNQKAIDFLPFFTLAFLKINSYFTYRGATHKTTTKKNILKKYFPKFYHTTCRR